MTIRVAFASLLIVSFLYWNVAEAKGETVALSLTGPTLTTPVHTIEEALMSANVWFGGFADFGAGPVDTAVNEDSDYRVYFWVQVPRGHVELKYMIWFRWDEKAGRGIVCLPSEEDIWYYVNEAAISRSGSGKCYSSDETWGAALKNLLLN